MTPTWFEYFFMPLKQVKALADLENSKPSLNLILICNQYRVKTRFIRRTMKLSLPEMQLMESISWRASGKGGFSLFYVSIPFANER